MKKPKWLQIIFKIFRKKARYIRASKENFAEIDIERIKAINKDFLIKKFDIKGRDKMRSG